MTRRDGAGALSAGANTTSVREAAPRSAGARLALGALRGIPPEAWTLAVSLNGFFLYLAVLDAVNVEPRTRLTAGFYGGLGLLLTGLAWRRRDVLIARLRAPARVLLAYGVLTALLAGWYLVNVALLSEGAVARRFAALLVLWSLPSALLAATFTRPLFDRMLQALTVLGLLFLVAAALAVIRTSEEVNRFTPIADLDEISAGLIPALSALACLGLAPQSALGRRFQLVAFTLLVAGAVLPGSRSPIVSLLLGVALVAALDRHRAWRIALPGVVVGIALGWLVATSVGSSYYYTYGLPGVDAQRVEEPISTYSLRKQWWSQALGDVPDRPIFGHGVAMLVDDTPEAHRMGIAGRRITPHNAVIESVYSLGVVGLALFAGLLAVVAWALWRLRPWESGRRVEAVVVGLFAFAFANANISGQVGADAVRWAVGALAAALCVDLARSPSRGA